MTSPKTNSKPKRTRYTSPKGESLFAHVVHVDYGTEQYPNKDGSFNILLALDEDAAADFRAMLAYEIDEARAVAEDKFSELKPAARKKLGQVSFNELGVSEYDKEENLTGRILFRFKTTAFYENRQGVKRRRKVPLFDSMQQPVSLSDEPGNGSLIRVAFTCAPYFVDGTGVGGLSLYLDAIQIIKLNVYGERTASEFGFGEEGMEGGFVAPATCPEDPNDEEDYSPESEEPGLEGAVDDVPF